MTSVYERALLEVNDDGKYQTIFDIVYNFFIGFFWVMCYFNIIMALAVTPHTCALPDKPPNISEFDWKLKYIPINKEVLEKKQFESCLIYVDPSVSNDTKPCETYSHDKTWYNSTVPSEYDWVCDKEIYSANILSICRMAELFGSLIFGWFGDRYGRRPLFMISLTLIIMGRSMSLFAGGSYLLFVIGCVIAATPSWSAQQGSGSISIEISSPERRTFSTSLRLTGCSLGTVVMPLIYWWLKDWQLFFLVTTVPLVPCLILAWFLLIESPQWLFIKGRSKECLKVLKQMANTNNTELQIATEKELLSTQSNTSGPVFGLAALFSSWILIKHAILQLLIWGPICFSYSVLLINSGQKSDGNPFLEFAMQAIVEIPSCYIGAKLADRFGRRYSGAGSFLIMSALWISIAIRENSSYGWFENKWMGSLLNSATRLTNSVAYYIINLFCMELYPTCLRQSGMALANIYASASSSFGPYIVYIGRRLDSRLPGIILTVSCIVGAVSFILLPETLNAKLPESLEDAKTFGRHAQKYTGLPLKVSVKSKKDEDLQNI